MQSKNPFDQALNGYTEDGLEGIGKKLKKARKKLSKSVKKVAKKVVKAHKKVASAVAKVGREGYRKFKRKALPDKVERALVKVEKSPITKGLAIGAAMYFGGPAIAGALGMKAPAMGSFGSFMAKTGAKEITKQYVGKKLSKKQQEAAKKAAQKAEAAASAELDAELRTIVDDPAFVGMARQMLEQGYDINQIYQAWMQSDAYADAAAIGASQATQPVIYDELVAAGASPDEAQELSEGVAAKMGIDAARQAQQNAKTGGGLLLLAIPLIMAAMGG